MTFGNELDIAEEKRAAQIRSAAAVSWVNIVRVGASAPIRLLAFEGELDDKRRIEWRSNCR